MSDEELIETLKAFEEKRVEQLPESARNLFYAIMKICDTNDRLVYENKKLKEELQRWKKKHGKI